MGWEERTKMMFSIQQLDKLHQAHILIVGLGGVGAYAAEMLTRAGIGELTIVDADTVALSNVNRQLVALHSTLNAPKVEVLSKRLLDINPQLKLHGIQKYLQDEEITEVLIHHHFDFVVDAIDTLSPKVKLMSECYHRTIPIVSSMGSGGKLDPTQVKIADIKKSDYCKLAKMCRKRLHRQGIRKGITVVYSPEVVPSERIELVDETHKSSNVGTISYMPAIFGCFLASHVIKTLTQE